MSHAFYADAWKLSRRRNTVWYQTNLLNVLQAAKEKRVRDVDASIALAEKLMRLLDEPLEHPVEVPLHNVIPSEDDSLMKPIEPEVLDILYKATEKGAGEKYLHKRNKKAPEDKVRQRKTRRSQAELSTYKQAYEDLKAESSLKTAADKNGLNHCSLLGLCSNWDYGWQQKQAKQRARDVNRGRCAILRDTFYRKNNLAPDPPHYGQPSGAEVSVCSEYSCNFN